MLSRIGNIAIMILLRISGTEGTEVEAKTLATKMLLQCHVLHEFRHNVRCTYLSSLFRLFSFYTLTDYKYLCLEN